MLLREHPRPPGGLADLLNWGVLVGDGVLVNKDGTFSAGWKFRGPDLFSATPAEVDVLAEHVNRALLPLGNDWLLHVDAVRSPVERYPTGGTFPDPLTGLIDEERRRRFETGGLKFETSFFLVLTHVPPEDRERKLRRFLVSGSAGSNERPDWDRQIAIFQKSLDDLEDLLSARLWLERLDSAALLRHLHFCLTGLDHSIAPPPGPYDVDFWLASADFYGGFEPRIGDRFVAPIAIRGLPHATRPGALDFLNQLGLAFRFSTRWLPLDAHTAERHLRRVGDKWFQKRKSLGDHLRSVLHRRPIHLATEEPFSNRDAARMADDADEARAEASGQRVRFGFYTPVLVLMRSDRVRLRRDARVVMKELRNHGFAADLETVNAVEAFRGSLPGHGWPNLRRPMIHTRNLADLLPATAVWPGPKTIPSPYFPAESPPLIAAASETTPFRLSLWNSDVGHTLLIGPTGSGKSTALGLLAAQFFRYEDAQVVFFDKGYSALPLALAAGGDHYDIASGESGPAFCPLSGIEKTAERSWAAEWLEALFELQGVSPFAPLHRRELHQALESLATLDLGGRTLTNLKLQLQDHDLREALRPYCSGGLFAHLLDAGSDSLETSRFQVFETAHLIELREKVLVPILLYLFHRMEQRLDGRPTLVVLDEAWTFLVNGLFARRIETWLRELRKKNAAVVFASQSLAEIRRSEQRYVIWESCPTKIFLPNAEAQTEQTSRLYREIGLNDREIEIVARAAPKRDYYVTSPAGRRLVDFEIGPFALSFLGATGREDLRAIRRLAAEHGSRWPAVWLERHRGLGDWGKRFEAGSKAITQSKKGVSA